MGKGAEYRILLRGGEYENAGKLTTVVFDKTGTLARCEPSVTDIIAFDGHGERDALELAAIVEKGSEHPLAEAVLRAADKAGLSISNAESFEAISGQGVKATFGGHNILFGSRKLMEENNPRIDDTIEAHLAELEEEGKTAMLLAVDGRIAGIIAAMDTPKDGAVEAIRQLKGLGLEVIMLTGDNERTARAIAKQLEN